MANYHKTERGNVDCEMVLQLFKGSVEIKKKMRIILWRGRRPQEAHGEGNKG